MVRILPRLSLFLTILAASAPLLAADLRDMKLVQDDAGTRAVLEIHGASKYKLFTLKNPDRLVLDLERVRPVSGFRLPPPNGAVASLRTGEPEPGSLRIVFDLGVAVATASHLERDGDSARLIVELSTGGQSLAAREPEPAQPAPSPAAMAPTALSVAAPVSLASLEPSLPPAPSPAAPVVAPSIATQDAEQVFARVAAPDTQSSTRIIAAPPVASAPPPRARLPARVVVPVSPSRAQVYSPPPTTNAGHKAARTLQDVIGPGQRKLVVAIDAGHGGKDPGAHGPSGVREKMVTLEVARELARQVNADPGMRAVLIRDNDTFVALKDRYMKARAAQADLFISIHADASPNNTANGASVFVLSTRGASSQAARWLANQENAADLVGGVSLDRKDFNLASVLLDLSQSATMRASDDIANQVLGSLKNVGKAHKPAIERANFVVLRSPDVPSMLIETGFITNPSEEQRLNDPGYRSRLAAAITDGVRRYFLDQAPPGSWYASRQGAGAAIGETMGAPLMASSPK
jgi:N-acetylmuramoyl-L-alanine amidase